MVEPASAANPADIGPGCCSAYRLRRQQRRQLWKGRLWNILSLLAIPVLVGVGIVMPNLRGARINTNESAAMASLRHIESAQNQLQASGLIDCNRDGAGEYGFIAELTGACAVRSDDGGKVGDTRGRPELAATFGAVRGGRVTRNGYVFQMFLPGKDGGWVGESPDGGSRGVAVDPLRAASAWMCYAWPEDYGVTGMRSFFVSQGGNILSNRNDNGRYSGDRVPTAGRAACLPGGEPATPKPAANTQDNDGDRWSVI